MTEPKHDPHSTEGWVDYFDKTTNREISPSLVNVVEHYKESGTALDLGCGGGRDTRYLVEKGFRVTAVDAQDSAKKYITKQILKNNVNFVCSKFEDLEFPANTYDIINAQFALPFIGSEKFDEVFAKLKASLRPDAVFVGNLFGDKDEWNIPSSAYAFQSEDEARGLLTGLNIIHFKNEEREGILANDKPKHWHTFEIIAQKPL